MKKIVFQKLFVTLLSMGIMSIDVESKMFNVKFRTLEKHEIVSQSEGCMSANQMNAKVSHCLVGQSPIY